MYVYMYVRMCVCVCMYVCGTYVCIYMCTYVYMYVCMYIYVCVYVYMYVCVCVYKQCQLCCQSPGHPVTQSHTHYNTSHYTQLPSLPSRTVPLSHTLPNTQLSSPSLPRTVPMLLPTATQYTTLLHSNCSAHSTVAVSTRRSLQTVTSLRTGQFAVSVPVRVTNFCFLRNVRSGSGPHAASIKVVMGILSTG